MLIIPDLQEFLECRENQAHRHLPTQNTQRTGTLLETLYY